MRLEPVDRPASLLARIMSFGMRRQLGRVITPARVVYNRVPRAWNVAWALLRMSASFRLESSLTLLVQARVAMLNGCAFCEDIARAFAVQQHLGTERFKALADWETSEVFDARERAALAYADEATREKRVSEPTFERLRAHFDEREIAEIALAVAIEHYYNLVNLPLEIPDDGLEALAEARHG